jgi:NAD(P)H-dependent FMN reductase
VSLLAQDSLARVQGEPHPGDRARIPESEPRRKRMPPRVAILRSMSQLVVPVIYGSVRTERQGIRAARFFVNELRGRGMNGVLVDPLEKQLPLLDRMYKEYPKGEAPPVLEELAELYRSADGFVIVSGEYNRGLPPALKNTLDYFLEEYYWRPAAIVSYSGGRWGGTRASAQLRSVLGEMGMVTIPTDFPIANVGDAFSENGEPSDPKMREQAAPLLDEFLWYVNALRTARLAGVPY